MQRKIAWVSILLLLIGMLGGCKKGVEETTQIAGSAAGFVQSEDAEEMIPPADQPEAEEPPKAGETITENKQETTTEDTEKTEPPQESTEPEATEPKATEPEATEPEEEIDLNAGNRFSPRKRREPGYDKYYCDATIDDEFEPGVVIVRLKNEVSYPNKKWPLSTFFCVDPASVVHSNYFDDPEVIAQTDLSSYTQRFKITLKEKTKEAVLKAIRELEKLDIVFYAQPNYIYSIELPAPSQNSFSDHAIDQIKLPAA